MFNNFSHKGNVNQNYIKIPSHLNKNDYDQENKQQQMMVRMQEKRKSNILLMKM
jgi:hypothetical protein